MACRYEMMRLNTPLGAAFVRPAFVGKYDERCT